jgi:YesN/AraC family two-component response regulator
MTDKTRVLIVDDNLGMLETLGDILTVSGFDVGTACDGQSAITMFMVRPYDVAVVDIIMPGMNGLDLIRRLKPDYPEAKFIVLTAYSNTPLAKEAEQVAAVLYKPADPDRIISLIREISAGSDKDKTT